MDGTHFVVLFLVSVPGEGVALFRMAQISIFFFSCS